MWTRNLLFFALVLGGVAALKASLFPPPRPVGSGGSFTSDDLQPIVAAINASFRQQWSAQEIQPAPRAPDLAIARRLSLALAGMIPSLQEIRQFESWPAESRLRNWLPRLLQDLRYADYFAERLARTYVGTEDGPFLVYRRRRFVSWLSDELFKNARYDSIVGQMIASDGLWTSRPATNFVAVTIDGTNEKRPNPERLAARVARAFLGLRLDCAQCHNHPFEHWKQHDFQGLAAFFGQTAVGVTGIHEAGGEYEMENRKTGGKDTIAPCVPFFPELLPDDGTRRQRLAHWVTDPKNRYFARAAVQRVWALLFGQPLLQSVEAMTSPGDEPPALDLLARDFTNHHYDLRRLIRVIASTEVFERDSATGQEITDAHERAWAAFPLTQLRPEQVAGSILQAASVHTLNDQSHFLVRIGRADRLKQFIHRYGDRGDDEFDGHSGTIPQRLLLMNGDLVHEKIRGELLNAATQIAALAPHEQQAVEAAYLAVLTRRPTAEEAAHFEARLTGRGTEPKLDLEDLFWILLNTTEFAWNH